jgi:MSHA biogenesis protein MshP
MSKMIRCNTSKKQTGIGLVSAIFVISVLAIIAAGMASLVANSGKLHSQQILTIRANNAANSGLEIALTKLQQSNNFCQSEQQSYHFDTQGLYDCKAQISCRSVEQQNQRFIALTSVGSCGSALDSASRTSEQFILSPVQ